MARSSWLLVAMLAMSCGSAEVGQGDGGTADVGDARAACSAYFGQDCGPEIDVTLRYVRDAGYDYSGAHLTCAPTACDSTKRMTTAQYLYAVVPTVQGVCGLVETSPSTRLIDCTNHTVDGGGPCFIPINSLDCLCKQTPSFALSTACDWTPALLPRGP